ncbi:ATP-dependent Clp protease adapter ClpS [Roseibacillus persicicus]|uniref:ATP-dependent Clp protease adapter protein ClpS n=1 Tax=Roseibacillus persicicus TaxID=454148 RepID=A0A918WI82_9BACT|nr:ATP-dependent Clp protease adapter ClpS [Roseibacillus persicicus]MDQ8190775.1 ATP-dependent Clp protease adapter ClpS [Roseibacillus persicicus]GHC53929.1 ATP-dependent Clp protease adapter protein ClpS [Roseibacillus persicicus]
MKAVTTDKPRTKSKTKSREKLAQPWKVVVYDDPVNLMEYVTRVFQKVFGYSREKAEMLMRQVHDAKRSVVWTGNREKAELYVQQLHGFQLHAGLEKDE